MPPCYIYGGCKNPDMSHGSHVCHVCTRPVHSFCAQSLSGVADKPDGGFVCGMNKRCGKDEPPLPEPLPDPLAGVLPATGAKCAAGSKCNRGTRGAVNVAKSCCGAFCHLWCTKLPCEACEAEDSNAQQANQPNGEGEQGLVIDVDVEALLPDGAEPSRSEAESTALEQEANATDADAGMLLEMSSTMQTTSPVQKSNGAVAGGVQQTPPASTPVKKAASSSRMGVPATPTRESVRIRKQQAQSAASPSDKMCTCNSVESNTAISASVNDAVCGLIKSPPFLKVLSNLVREKTFEDAVSDAGDKLPLNKAELKRVLADNTATVHTILSTALQPELKKACECIVEATLSMADATDGLNTSSDAAETATVAMVAATTELETSCGPAVAETPKRGGRKTKPRKGANSASPHILDAKDASSTGIQHVQLVGVVQNTVTDTLTAKVDPRFEQLTAAVQSALQQCVQILRQMATADVTALKGDISSARTELKGDISSARTEVKGDISSARTELASLKGDTYSVRTELSEITAAVRQVQASCDMNATDLRELAKARKRTAPPSYSESSSSDSSVAPPTPPPVSKKHRNKHPWNSQRERPGPPLRSVDPNTARMSTSQLRRIASQTADKHSHTHQHQPPPQQQNQPPPQQHQPPPQQHQPPPQQHQVVFAQTPQPQQVVVAQPPQPQQVVVAQPPQPQQVVVAQPPQPQQVVVAQPPQPQQVVLSQPPQPQVVAAAQPWNTITMGPPQQQAQPTPFTVRPPQFPFLPPF